jgi:hypothetical protein
MAHGIGGQARGVKLAAKWGSTKQRRREEIV